MLAVRDRPCAVLCGGRAQSDNGALTKSTTDDELAMTFADSSTLVVEVPSDTQEATWPMLRSACRINIPSAVTAWARFVSCFSDEEFSSATHPQTVAEFFRQAHVAHFDRIIVYGADKSRISATEKALAGLAKKRTPITSLTLEQVHAITRKHPLLLQPYTAEADANRLVDSLITSGKMERRNARLDGAPTPSDGSASYNAPRILPWLYVCDWETAGDANFIKAANITSVLSVGVEPLKPVDVKVKRYFTGPFFDSNRQESMLRKQSALPAGVNFIIRQSASGHVLVHCAAGRSRSVTIVIAALMRHYKISLLEAFILVLYRRPTICPHFNFLHLVQDYATKHAHAGLSSHGRDRLTRPNLAELTAIEQLTGHVRERSREDYHNSRQQTKAHSTAACPTAAAAGGA